jgi:hypothetical protein
MEDSLLVNPWNLEVCVFFSFLFSKFSFSSIVFIHPFFNGFIGHGSRHQPRSPHGSSRKNRSSSKLYKVVTTHIFHTCAAVLVKMLLGQMGLQGGKTDSVHPEREAGTIVCESKEEVVFDVCFCCYFSSFALPFV